MIITDIIDFPGKRSLHSGSSVSGSRGGLARVLSAFAGVVIALVWLGQDTASSVTPACSRHTWVTVFDVVGKTVAEMLTSGLASLMKMIILHSVGVTVREAGESCFMGNFSKSPTPHPARPLARYVCSMVPSPRSEPLP